MTELQISRKTLFKLGVAGALLAACKALPGPARRELPPTPGSADIYRGIFPPDLKEAKRLEKMIDQIGIDMGVSLGLELPRGKIKIMPEADKAKLGLVTEMLTGYGLDSQNPNLPSKPLLPMHSGDVYLDPYHPLISHADPEQRYGDIAYLIATAYIYNLTWFNKDIPAVRVIPQNSQPPLITIDGAQGLGARTALVIARTDKFMMFGFHKGVIILAVDAFKKEKGFITGLIPEFSDMDSGRLVLKTLIFMNKSAPEIIRNYIRGNKLLEFIDDLANLFVVSGGTPETPAKDSAGLVWALPGLVNLGAVDYDSAYAALTEILKSFGKKTAGLQHSLANKDLAGLLKDTKIT